MYLECPKRYWFRYIEKVPEKPKYFFSFGRSIHNALEFFYGGKEPAAPSLPKLLKAYKVGWVSEAYRDRSHEEMSFEQGKSMLIAFYHKHEPDFSLPLAVERRLDAKIDDIPVVGVVDRIDDSPDGGLSLMEYKTGKTDRFGPGSGERDRGKVGQLVMYQLLAEQAYGRKVDKVTFYFIPTLTAHEYPRAGEDASSEWKRVVVSTAKSICEEDFKPAPEEKKCLWCDYKPLCPVFHHERPVSSAVEEYAAQEPIGRDDEELALLVDRFGETQAKAHELGRELHELKSSIVAILAKKGYARAFGKKFEATVTREERWEFQDKKKVLELIRTAGLYETILAPSAPLVQKLMRDPGLEPSHRASLEASAQLTEVVDLKVSPVAAGGLPLFGRPAKKR